VGAGGPGGKKDLGFSISNLTLGSISENKYQYSKQGIEKEEI
jgi:hypothetical protein